MKAGPDNLARTVIYDPVTQNLRATRYGLYEAGFREIEGYNELGEVRKRLASGPMDLLVAEAGENEEVYDLVRQLRQGKLSENPFSVVFITSWRSDQEAVGAALRSGADDLIIRPFSTNFIDTRIRSAIDNRKQFVVTSDYMGPDRRGAVRDEAGPRVRMFDAPNTLQSAVKGDRGAMEARQAEIESYKDIVRRERAVRIAVKIGVEIQLAKEGKRPSSSVYMLARELYVAVDQVDPEAAKLAGAMVRGLSSSDDLQKSFKLAKELALGVCVICGEHDAGEDAYVSEIEGLLGNVRDRDEEQAA